VRIARNDISIFTCNSQAICNIATLESATIKKDPRGSPQSRHISRNEESKRSGNVTDVEVHCLVSGRNYYCITLSTGGNTEVTADEIRFWNACAIAEFDQSSPLHTKFRLY
jgi:hypothetical protein